MNPHLFDRRTFLRGTAAAGIGLATGRLAAATSANDKLTLGIIGSGGRGRSLMKSFNTMPGVEFAAVCDVYEDSTARALKLAGEKAKTYDDHRQVLDRKDIDAVVDRHAGSLALSATGRCRSRRQGRLSGKADELVDRAGQENGPARPRARSRSCRLACSGAARRA